MSTWTTIAPHPTARAVREWERLLADIEAGKIDAVAAWDQDRVNRMMEDFIAYKKLFVQRGILLATSNNGDIDLVDTVGCVDGDHQDRRQRA